MIPPRVENQLGERLRKMRPAAELPDAGELATRYAGHDRPLLVVVCDTEAVTFKGRGFEHTGDVFQVPRDVLELAILEPEAAREAREARETAEAEAARAAAARAEEQRRRSLIETETQRLAELEASEDQALEETRRAEIAAERRERAETILRERGAI